MISLQRAKVKEQKKRLLAALEAKKKMQNDSLLERLANNSTARYDEIPSKRASIESDQSSYDTAMMHESTWQNTRLCFALDDKALPLDTRRRKNAHVRRPVEIAKSNTSNDFGQASLDELLTAIAGDSGSELAPQSNCLEDLLISLPGKAPQSHCTDLLLTISGERDREPAPIFEEPVEEVLIPISAGMSIQPVPPVKLPDVVIGINGIIKYC